MEKGIERKLETLRAQIPGELLDEPVWCIFADHFRQRATGKRLDEIVKTDMPDRLFAETFVKLATRKGLVLND